jgi:N-acetylneuraminate synthase
MGLYLIAEIGINHNGSLEIAKKLIDAAADAGMDAVKFQKRTVEKVYSKEFLNSPRESPWGTTQRDQKMALEFSYEQYKEIDRYCKEIGIAWSASAWDLDSLRFLQRFERPFNKVASPMLGHKPLLREIIAEGIKTWLLIRICADIVGVEAFRGHGLGPGRRCVHVGNHGLYG